MQEKERWDVHSVRHFRTFTEKLSIRRAATVVAIANERADVGQKDSESGEAGAENAAPKKTAAFNLQRHPPVRRRRFVVEDDEDKQPSMLRRTQMQIATGPVGTSRENKETEISLQDHGR